MTVEPANAEEVGRVARTGESLVRHNRARTAFDLGIRDPGERAECSSGSRTLHRNFLPQIAATDLQHSGKDLLRVLLDSVSPLSRPTGRLGSPLHSVEPGSGEVGIRQIGVEEVVAGLLKDGVEAYSCFLIAHHGDEGLEDAVQRGDQRSVTLPGEKNAG